MTPVDFVVAGFGLLAVWGIATWASSNWGARVKTWEVWCPVHKKEARIVAIQRQAQVVPAGAAFQILDVKRCSLFGSVPVTCGKECLERP